MVSASVYQKKHSPFDQAFRKVSWACGHRLEASRANQHFSTGCCQSSAESRLSLLIQIGWQLRQRREFEDVGLIPLFLVEQSRVTIREAIANDVRGIKVSRIGCLPHAEVMPRVGVVDGDQAFLVLVKVEADRFLQ